MKKLKVGCSLVLMTCAFQIHAAGNISLGSQCLKKFIQIKMQKSDVQDRFGARVESLLKSSSTQPDDQKKYDRFSAMLKEMFEFYGYYSINVCPSCNGPDVQAQIKSLAAQCREFIDAGGKYSSIYYADILKESDNLSGDSSSATATPHTGTATSSQSSDTAQ